MCPQNIIMLTRKKRIVFIGLAAVLGMVIVLAFAEMATRLRPRLYCEGYRPSRNDRIVFELYPGYKIGAIDAKISAQGLNDRYYPPRKPQGVFRIAVVGDSSSFGWMVPRADSFPKILERRLNERKQKRFEVINFSVPGYNTAQELALIQDRVVRFDPDMVLLVFCENDTKMANYFKPRVTPANYFYNRSCFIRYLLCRIDHHWMDYPAPLRRAWVVFKKDVLGMFYFTARMYPYPGLEEVDFIFRNPPDSPRDVPPQYRYMVGYDNYRIHISQIQDFLGRKGIRFVSTGGFIEESFRINQELGVRLLFDFREIPQLAREDHYLSKTDRHYSPLGHRTIAESLFRFLDRNVFADVPD